jgi:hypothetical protein
MGLDDYISSESQESGGSSAEISEAFKESVKRAAAWVQRTQKDEGKAKKYDFFLASFLVQIILRREFDTLHASIFACLTQGLNSNMVLGVLSLIYEPIQEKIRDISEKPYYPFDYINTEKVDFSDYSIPEEIKSRINLWVEDIMDVISIETSSITTQKTLICILDQEKLVVDFISEVFSFFLAAQSISISQHKSASYGLFILAEVRKTLKRLKTEEI